LRRLIQRRWRADPKDSRDAQPQRKLKKGRVLTEVAPGIPDGFRIDIDGAISTSAGDGVHCITA